MIENSLILFVPTAAIYPSRTVPEWLKKTIRYGVPWPYLCSTTLVPTTSRPPRLVWFTTFLIDINRIKIARTFSRVVLNMQVPVAFDSNLDFYYGENPRWNAIA